MNNSHNLPASLINSMNNQTVNITTMNKTLLSTSLLSSLIALPNISIAEETTAASAPVAAEAVWDGNAELGFIQTSGNSDTQSLNGRFNLSRELDKLKTALKLEALTSEDSGERSSEKYLAQVKVNYAIGEYDYLTSLATYQDDRFSGYEYQSVLAVGYGYHAWNDKNGKLDLEAGPGYRRDVLKDRNSDGDKIEEEAIARLGLDLLVNISDTAKFTEVFTIEAGDSNVIYKSDMGIQSTLAGELAMKVSYQVVHATNVPANTKNTDSLVGVTLVYDF